MVSIDFGRWRENKGFIPRALDRRGARVEVELRNGMKSAPKTWEAQSARWTLTDHPFDIIRFRVAKL